MNNKTTWSTGIVVRDDDDTPGWHATINFSSRKTENGDCVKGEITYYKQGKVTGAIDDAIDGANKLGINFLESLGLSPFVTYFAGGHHENFPPPENFEEMLLEQNIRLGWVIETTEQK
jgi:hypothetical protein